MNLQKHFNKSKLLVICGPTATGKTALALHLAKVFNGVPISADSRQVYKFMDIGTGKEGKMLGYDLVNPDEEFSVSQYLKFANKSINKIVKQQKLPILVGGTGLYIKAVLDGMETVDIPPNKSLREELSQKSVNELFIILQKINPQKAISMNSSDRKNPRRLIRAIEIGMSPATKPNNRVDYDILIIGLSAPTNILQEKIEKRVDERINLGFEKEYEFLKNANLLKHAPSVTLGYKDWPDINKWKSEEFKYAKRQLTWFKKDKRIKWFDIIKPDFTQKIKKLVQKWLI